MKSFDKIAIFFFWILLVISAQGQMVIPQVKTSKKTINNGSELLKSTLVGTYNPTDLEENWDVSIRNLEAFQHASSVTKKEFQKLKDEANQTRLNPSTTERAHNITSRNTPNAPYLNFNFTGNTRSTSIPMDNSIAVSRNGFIVSAINTNIIFAGPDGNITYSKGLSEFFTLLNLGNRMYDPRVVYDVFNHRFVAMCLSGSDPNSTNLCVAFSKTEDPNGEWNYYKIQGNIGDANTWFDYPNISVSEKDLYIAGLMRNRDGFWQYSVLYQCNMKDGYDGQELRFKHYKEIFDADGEKSFNLVPVHNGWNTPIAPGMYFVSNEELGGDKYNLYFTDNSVLENPQLTAVQTRGLATLLAPDARQLNTTNILNTFDSRIWSATYVNGMVHMGGHTNTPNGDVGIFYVRLDIENLKTEGNIFTTAGIDYGFPSFAPAGKKQTDDAILVNYLISSPNMFPGQEQRIVAGTGDVFEWSEPTVLKIGESFVDALFDDLERWGDYTTVSRRFINDRVENWVVGCYGLTRSYGTWIGQYLDQNEFNTKPMAEFVADKTTTRKLANITFKDLTQNTPSEWKWEFEGGVPNSSTEQNPSITYNENGFYDVKLIVKNSLGIDTLTKPDYIQIVEPIFKPTADFSFNKDTIFINDEIQFTNLSSNNHINYVWTFVSGTPATSREKDPKVAYNRAGNFLVSLNASNIAGSNVKIRNRLITVRERTTPSANFMISRNNLMKGETVLFSDLSKGGPTSWRWEFEGGNPSSSTVETPSISYLTEGKFTVKLVASNQAGADSIERIGYVTVGNVATDQQLVLDQMQLFPNPNSGQRMTFAFNAKTAQKLKVEVINLNGMLIKELYNDKIKQGQNEMQFNVNNLKDGYYFLKVVTNDNKSSMLRFTIFK